MSDATGLGKMEHPGGSSRAEGGEQPASAAQPGSTPVPGYEGLYEIDRAGVVHRLAGHDSIGRPRRRRHLSPWLVGGYPCVELSKNAIAVRHFVHHLVTAAFIGARPAGMQVNHIDGDKTNNSVRNLEYVTKLENEAHAARMGLKARGSRHGMSKLTEDDVRAIRHRSEWCDESYEEIARDYPVHTATVRSAALGITWAHL